MLVEADRDPSFLTPRAADDARFEVWAAHHGLFRNYDVYLPYYLGEGADADGGEGWESDFDSDDEYGRPVLSPPKRVRRSADEMAMREAFIDPAIAARALHTGARRTLRNRSVPEEPPARPNLP